MPSFLELFGGAADGTVLSTSNTSLSSVVGSPEIDTAVVFKVPGAMRIPSTAGTATYGFVVGLVGTTQISGSFYCRFASVAPAATMSIMSVRESPGGTQLFGLRLLTNGRLIAAPADGSTIATSDIAAHALSANNWYRVDYMGTIGTITTGRVQYRICDVNAGDTDIPITTAYDSTANQNLGTGSVDRVYLGAISAVASNGDYAFGIMRADTSSTSFYTQYTDAIKGVIKQFGANLSTAANFGLPVGAAAGDLMLWFISSDATGGTAITLVGGSGGSTWTNVTNSTIAVNVHSGALFSMILTGATGDNLGNPSGAAQDYTAIGVLFDASRAFSGGITGTSTTDAASTAVNPPSHAPGGGYEYTYLAWGTIDKSAAGNNITISPTNYTALMWADSAASTTSSYAWLAYRVLASTSDDPGTFTNTARPWVSVTAAVTGYVPAPTIIVGASRAAQRAASW